MALTSNATTSSGSSDVTATARATPIDTWTIAPNVPAVPCPQSGQFDRLCRVAGLGDRAGQDEHRLAGAFRDGPLEP
jgi:hypothetical protein